MRHDINIDDPRAPEMAEAIEKCVHCGFCLAACPTYKLLGEEMDSPRGRIYLMKTALEGRIDPADAQPYIDRCLGCMACVPACPSEVAYGDLLVGYRARQESQRERPPLDAMTRKMVIETLPYPRRFRLAARAGKLGKWLAPALPPTFSAMLDLLPSDLPPSQALPETLPAQGKRRGVVALLPGCAQQVLAPGINHAAARLLAANGVDVHVPRAAGCCGSILLHIGAEQEAQALARRNFAAIADDVDAIITTAAGCGSGIKDYPLLFKNQPEAAAAQSFAAKTMDFSAYLAGIGLRAPMQLPTDTRVVYQDACHLLHAQGHKAEPRALLREVGNLQLLEIADADTCCGSAGTYNIDQPEIASQLGARKAAAILSAQPDVVVSGNIGCITQIRQQLAQHTGAPPVRHIAQLLHSALP
ncbi:MAG: glycolate oxidase subunit GlcF [Chloroflexi bacterium]|nr:glycolate oxidase subunit GlcF [Chloroflexota bacterium]MCY4248234.1 glycolate oxidase subunit GlcF [Chloroflexota bacterium]